MIQWTAGIRLAMYEYTTLQEAYTGALIAGKGKFLNNINIIMERSKQPTADWARVRFGAGTPWRRCWCVISPPEEKEYQKLQKQMNKKKSAYARSTTPMLKGDIRFYDTKKTKKVKPIATITNAYSAFAIYPQSKPLIDASTLVKLEGSITIHSNPPTSTEGFVFVMPEVHPAVSGFEMMLRWLFPVWDTFGLYGRPGRLIADTSDTRSLMFAMPKHRRYGYLETLDVSSLILESGSGNWKESEWRTRMKDLTSKRMTALDNGSQPSSRYNSRKSARNSYGPSCSRIQFNDGVSVRSTPSLIWDQAQTADAAGYGDSSRVDSAPPAATHRPITPQSGHQRSVSEAQGTGGYRNQVPNYDGGYDEPPIPPVHGAGFVREGSNLKYSTDVTMADRVSSEEDEQPARTTPVRELEELQTPVPPQPVVAPPAFSHAPGAMPASKPYHSPELRRANSRISTTTLKQMAVAGGLTKELEAGMDGGEYAGSQERRHEGPYVEKRDQRGVLSDAKVMSSSANQEGGGDEGVVVAANSRFSFEEPVSSAVPPQVPPHVENISPYRQQSLNQSSSSIPAHSSNSPAEFAQSSSQSLPIRGPNTQSYNNRQSFVADQPVASSNRATGQAPQGAADSTQGRPQSGVVHRKPLPDRTSKTPETMSHKPGTSTTGSGPYIDQSGMARVHDATTAKSESPIKPLDSGVSDYGDTASTDSPDYASITKPSFESKRSIEKPRAGVLKTVGNEGQNASAGIPDVDFGPTLNLASGRLSPGPGVALQSGHTRNKSSSPARYTPSPTRNVVTAEFSHQRTDSSGSRTVAWQPGMGVVGNPGTGKAQTITPEQFVQQRAAAASPAFGHARQQSSNALRGSSPRSNTPISFSHSRNNSADLLQTRSSSADLLHPRNSSTEFLHHRNNSTDLLQRPGSRDATTALGGLSAGEYASKLSAREQEHIARITGQPLVSLPAKPNRPLAPEAGLVGAIGAREREKAQMKKGLNSQAVENAIAMRQQELLAQQQAQMQSYQQYPQQYYDQSGAPFLQQPQNWGANMNAFGPGGAWSTASTYSPGTDGGPNVPPQYFGGSNQQYPGHSQQGQGRGRHQGYYGQGY